eukprot:jgi/Chrpa1/4494/Chrysochromulina_OHIO_Genome00018008-RA
MDGLAVSGRAGSSTGPSRAGLLPAATAEESGSLAATVTGTGGVNGAAAEWRRQRLELAESAMIRAVALVSSGEKTDTAAYNMAIAGCRHVGRPVQALSLYERMREAGVPADRQTYEHALVCAMRLRRHAQALAVWEQLCADPHVVPGRVEYTAAISACERSGEYGRALALFDAMQAKGVVPDSNAMHVAVLAANQIRQPARASEMLSRIELLGARPPTELYNGAMLACAATEQWTLAAELFTRMHRLGVPRDAASYSAVIWACHVGTGAHEGARTKLLLAVDHLLQEPAERVRGWTGDIQLCDAAFEACAFSGHWRSALRWYVRTLEACARHAKWQIALDVMACSHAGNWAQVLHVYERMQAEGVAPSVTALNAVVLALGKTGRTIEALDLFERMLRGSDGGDGSSSSDGRSGSGLGRPLDTASYNAALVAAVDGAKYSTALQLMQRMLSSGVRMNALSFTAAITAAQKLGNTSLSMSLLEQMTTTASAAAPAAAPSSAQEPTLLEPSNGSAPPGHEEEQQQEQQQHRWRYTEAVALLSKLGRARDGARGPNDVSAAREPGGAVAGEERVSTARANGVSDVPGIRRPVWHTAAYNEAIAACVRDGQHADALALFDRMRSASPAERVEPDRTTLSLAARALAIEGKRDESYQLLREIRSRGEEPDRTALLALLSACADASSWDMALRVLEETSTALNRPPTAAAATTAATATTAAASMGAVAGAGMGDAAAKVETATAAAAALASVQHGSSGSGELRALAMRACNNAGRWQYALRLFDAVRRTGAVPGATEWQEAMHSFAAGGLGQRAAVGLNVMARAGIGGVTFGVIESNVALSAAARSGRLSEAVQLLVEMADPDVGSYDAVLARLVSTARHQDALALFERMLASGLSPLEHHYRIAIGACASIAQGGRAAELLLDMQARGMVFSAAAADAMHACNAAGMPEVALDIFEAIRFEAATPNSAAATSAANSVHVFNAALDALRRQSEPSAAVDLLLSMHSKHSAEPLGSSYAIALSACRRSGRLDMLPRVLQAAVEHSERRPGWLCTDELHSELVRSLAEAGEPHAALRCYVQLVQARVPLSAALYNALLPALERCAGAGVLGLSTLGTALGTGRGRSAVVSARMRDPHERRIDAADGKPYSRDEFADFYGDDADLMWAAAARITSSVGAHGGAPTGAAAPGSVAAEAAAAPALRVVEHGLAMGAFGETLSLAGELLEINLSPFTTPAALRAAVHYWAHALRAQLDALDGDVALTDVVFLAGASADSSAEEASSVRTASRVALSLRLFSPLQLGKSEDHTGHIHLLYSRDNKEVFVTRSTDGGESWGASTNLTASLKLELDPESIFVATGPPGGVQLASGRLVGGFYYNGLNGTRSAAIFSDDHGATWRRGAEVFVSQTPLPNASSVVYMGGECQVTSYAPAGPQGLVMLMRVRGDFPTNAVDHNHATAISRDGGETWTVASLIHATSSYCEGSIATVGKSVLISAPSTTNGGRANLTVWAARPVGESLDAQYSLTVYPGASAYSSMLAGKRGGTVLNLFERDNDPYVPKNLTLATFDVPALR